MLFLAYFLSLFFARVNGEGCNDGSVEQEFTSNVMVGCDGSYTMSNFRSACAPGWHVANASEYFSYGGTSVRPNANRWIDVTWDSSGRETSLDNFAGYYDLSNGAGWQSLSQSSGCRWVSSAQECHLSFIDRDYGKMWGCHCRGSTQMGVVCVVDGVANDDVLEYTKLTTANLDGDYVTLYKMVATTGFSDDDAGVNQYRQICESQNLQMVGCGTANSYYCHEEDNCIPMPSSWGCNMLSGISSNTGWTNIVALQTDGRNAHLYAHRSGPRHPTAEIMYHAVCGFVELGFVDDASCQWHAMNKMNKVINANQFFGFECPPNQIISELRLEGYGARSVLENNPTAILCCELGGYTLVTNTCVDSYSTADGILEAAICQGNSAMAAIYDLSDPTLEQGQWQYQATKAVTCCDIEYDTSYGHNLDLGIDRSQCEVISHSNQVGSFDVSCPEDMVLIAIRDNDLAHGVQEVHEVECCKVHQATAPSKTPTATPTTDQPSSAPTTSCYQCLIEVHGNNVSDQEDFVGEIQACLSHCCA